MPYNRGVGAVIVQPDRVAPFLMRPLLIKNL